MTAKQGSQNATGKRPHWTLVQLRERPSDLRGEPLDVDAWQTLQRWAKWVAIAGWGISFLLTIIAAYLALARTPQPVPLVQEEHGIVTRLATVPSVGALHVR